MKIKNLKIVNIGPFKNANLDFTDEDSKTPYPVIIITGENGTGKSIIIDAIRGLLMGRFRQVERNIISSDNFLVESIISLDDKNVYLKSSQKYENIKLDTNDMYFNQLFLSQFETKYKRNFIFEYWTSKLSNDDFKIQNLEVLDPKNYLDDSYNGIHKNIDVTKIISFFDYLRGSNNPSEKKLGQTLYGLLEQIINLSISEGKLSHVSRINFEVIISINGREVALSKLSSGNLYLIQRFASVLRQVYSICIINQIDIENYKEIPGLLLIDEAENHLHPKWQKVFLKNLLRLFPKIQIITTTHSPFIVSSVKNAKIFVCRSKAGYSVVEEETDYFSNKPVEEILMSPLFNTSNFGVEISNLLTERKIALQEGKDNRVQEIERVLLSKNPDYFNYLKIDELIKSLKR